MTPPFACFAGVAVTAIHFQEVRDQYHQVPIPLLLGPSNTWKSLLAKVCASLVGGLHRAAMYGGLSAPKLINLMSRSAFFIYNDPDKNDILKTLIAKVRKLTLDQGPN